MKTIKSIVLTILTICSFLGAKAQNYAWPAQWEGVMLQGFYWDSYSDSKWTKLTSQADELSSYFKLIWVPNSAKAGSGNQMGYMPQYWFTNHNCSFGTEAQLREMISTYKAKGVGIIEDVVINHRNGVSSWADFPSEEWNGQTWHIGLDGICRNDNLAGSGHGTPTGAYDTGEQFDGCRDLDHTNANVQNCCKNYCKFLLEDLGYAGFRLDMVKGYAGKYTKMYNEYSKPTYCVGEYFDGSYDAVKAWIDATGKQSAAFDFPFKYALNEAFSSNDMTKLVWLAEYKTPQPAGMIHYGYQQYAVTFIDNHDTYRDSWNKFNGNVVAANAFMLCSPGTPCVFLPHYKQYKSQIQTLINIRNSVGLHNQSPVNVLKTTSNCYMAEVTGKKGKLVVKIGSAMDSPSGYSNSDIVASGDGYCVWTKTSISGTTTQGGDNPEVTEPQQAPDQLYIMGHIPGGSWTTNNGIKMTRKGNAYTAENVEILDSGEDRNLGYFSFVTKLGTTGASSEWDEIVNSSDRFGATSKDLTVKVGEPATIQLFEANVDASAANSWAIEPGKYTITADFDTMKLTVKESGSEEPEDPKEDPKEDPETNPGNYPDLWIVGYAYGVTPPTNYKMECKDGIYTIEMGDLSGAFAIAGNGLNPFFTTADREMTIDKTYVCDSSEKQLMYYPEQPKDVVITFNYKTKELTVTKQSGTGVLLEDYDEVVYFNLQGQQVPVPTKGNIYIVKKGNKSTKICY